MRLLLALLAVLAMLANPAISAARASCGGAPQKASSAVNQPSVASMEMPEMAGDGAMPCCPEAKPKPTQPQKQDGKGCAQMCAAFNELAFTTGPISFAKHPVVVTVVLTASAEVSACSFEPLGLERPPRRIA